MAKKILISSVLAPVMSLGLFAAPALASHWNWNSDDTTVTVTNSNSAYVSNNVDASASTGHNDANGGNGGGSAGNGGAVIHSDDNNTGGDGGNGGNGGDGGTIGTGDATAGVSVDNKVNTNKTSVNLCGCLDNNGDTTVNVSNTNHAKVKNYVDAKAKTGGNDANGGDANGGSAGNGGAVIHSDDGNTGGNGGNAGNGGWGGLILTGNASAGAAIVNRVNTNITHVN